MGRSGQRPEFSQATGMALVRCILGKFLGVACHCLPPLFRCSHFSPPGASTSATTWEIPAVELWARMLSANFAEMTTSKPFRDLLHAANLRHRTDGFTSPRTCWRFVSPLKIRRLRPGLNPRNWVLKASTLPLDQRSRLELHTDYKLKTFLPFFNEYINTAGPSVRAVKGKAWGRSPAEIVGFWYWYICQLQLG